MSWGLSFGAAHKAPCTRTSTLYLLSLYRNQKQTDMLITIAIIASFIGIVPSANTPSKPAKQETVKQVMRDEKTVFYDLGKKKK